MNLQIRDPRAHRLARRLADRRQVSMTEAAVGALEAAIARTDAKESIAETIERLHADLVRAGQPCGRAMTKDEIDGMWGHADFAQTDMPE